MKLLIFLYFNKLIPDYIRIIKYMQIIKIEENDANQRLDKFLKKLFVNATRALIYKFNRK
jgi:hypothetical protein